MVSAGLAVGGWCLLSLLGPKDIHLTLVFPSSVGLGLSIVSLAAWLAWITHTGLRGAATVSGLVGAGLLIARFVWRSRASGTVRPGRLEAGAALWSLVVVALALATGPWLSQTADSFYHLAAARSLLRTGDALPQDIFFGVQVPYPDVTSGSLHVVLAWLSLLTGMIPALKALTALGAVFTALSFTAFVRELTRSTPAALTAASLYLILGLDLDMRTASYPNRIGLGLAWLSVAFLVRAARSDSKSWRELVPACLLAFTAGSLHSGMAPLVVVMVATTLFTAVLVAAWRRRLRSLSPLAIGGGAVLLAVLPILAVRILAIPSPGLDGSFVTEAPPLKVHVLFGYPFVDFRFWFGGLVTITTVGTVCLLGRARTALLAGDPGGAMLWGGSLIVPAVCVTPLLTNSAEGLYYFARIADLLIPLMFVTLGWELSAAGPRVGAALRTIATKRPRDRSLVPAVLVAAATIALVGEYVPSGIHRYFGHGQFSVSASRHNDLTQRWADRLQALDAAGPGALLAGLDSSYELAGLMGRRVVAVPYSHMPFQDEARDGPLRRGDLLDALKPAPNPTILLSVLLRYKVTFVVVDRALDGQPAWDWMAGQRALSTIAQGTGWTIYRFDQNRMDQALDIPVSGGTGVGPERTIAGRALFVRFTPAGRGGQGQVTVTGLSTGTTYRAGFVLPDTGAPTFTAALLLPDTAAVERYRVTVSMAGSSAMPAGVVEVGRDYEAETFAGVIDFYSGFFSGGYFRNPGWVTTYGDYSRGMASVGLRTGSVAHRILIDPPGDYCLDVRILDAGDGRPRALDVNLGGAVTSLTWGDQMNGPRDLTMRAQAGSASRQLSYWVPPGSALPVTVDRITLYPPPDNGGSC